MRADLLVAPGTLEKTSLQLEYLPSGDVCRGRVTNVGRRKLQRHLPAPERRAADDPGQLGAERSGNRRRRPDHPECIGRRSSRLACAALLAGCGSGGAKGAPTTTTAPKPSNSLLRGKTRLQVARIGSLPRAFSKAAAVALPHGRLMVLGGYTGGRSLDTILAGPPSRLRVVGRLPQPTHDAAAAAVGGNVYLFGGGESVSMPSVVRVDPRTGGTQRCPRSASRSPTSAPSRSAATRTSSAATPGRSSRNAILRYLPQGGGRDESRGCRPARAMRASRRWARRSTSRAG